MGLLTRIFRPRTETRASTVPALPDTIGVFATHAYNDAGVAVNEEIALTASAVYACVAVIANAIAALPVHILRRDDGAKQVAHPVAQLLGGEPNEFQTAPMFRETMLVNLLLWGNCYAYIERDELGRPIALLPLRSDRTRPIRTPAGQLIYQTLLNGVTETLLPADVLHVSNISLDGITGLSPILQAKQSIGLSLALERFAAQFFSSGCHVGGVLTVPSLKSDGMKSFAQKFREQYTGQNASRIAVLENGMTYVPTMVDPEKSQALEQRVHQLREIARIYRVPPHKIGDLERATFSNIEHQSLEFVQDTLMPWVVKLEAEANRKLLLEREKPLIEVKFNLDSLLRADTAARYAAHAAGLNAGFLTVNEVRLKENLPPIDGGDVLRSPLNMAPAIDSKKPDATATRSLIEDAARRLLVKESKALTRAAKKHQGKPDELRQWANQFYSTHRQLVAKVITPALTAAGQKITPEQFAEQHCTESIRQISESQSTDDLSDSWESIRPGEIADTTLNNNKERTHAA